MGGKPRPKDAGEGWTLAQLRIATIVLRLGDNGDVVSQVREADIYAMVLGAVIGRLRKQRKWTQGDMVREAGVTQSTLSRLETGKVAMDAFLFRNMAIAFSLKPSRLQELVEEAYQRIGESL